MRFYTKQIGILWMRRISVIIIHEDVPLAAVFDISEFRIKPITYHLTLRTFTGVIYMYG